MYADYWDIRSRIAAPPTWFDEHGAPRYGVWEPGLTCIYADESALFEIACQGCGMTARIGMDRHALWARTKHLAGRGPDYRRPSSADPGSYYFGDFPRRIGPDGTDCCAGVTMTTSVTRIVEFWLRDGEPGKREWVRHREYEFVYPQEAGGSDGNRDTGAGPDAGARGTRLDA